MIAKKPLFLAIGWLFFDALRCCVVGQTSLPRPSLRQRQRGAVATTAGSTHDDHHSSGPAWRSRGGKLFYGDDVFELKGVNWNGIESDCRVVHGLWENTLDFYMDMLESHRFNAIRLPISYEVMSQQELTVNSGCVTKEPGASAMKAHAFLQKLMNTFQHRGMFVLLDLHSIGGQITELPWTASVSENDVVDAWVVFARTFALHPAVMGLEIKNEPHGPCTTVDFHRHAARVITAILEAVPSFNGTFFIDGTQQDGDGNDDSTKAPWGGTFEMMVRLCEEDALCRLGLDDRLVFAPHVYGPDVRGSGVLCEDGAVFDRRFGFLRNHPFFNQSAIVVTEFGGKMEAGGEDLAYFERWWEYMAHGNMTAGAFFWTLPPSSDDTGGFIMNDWRSADPTKAAFLDTIQPSPSRFFP